MDSVNNTLLASNAVLDNEQYSKETSSIDQPTTVTVKTADGTNQQVALETLLLLALLEKTEIIKDEGKKISEEIDGVCKKIKMLDTLYKDVLELSEKDGSINWEKKGLGSSIEALRNEGFVIPAKKGILPREERDALLRSLTQQSDDGRTQTAQLNVKLNRCHSLYDDQYRFISSLLKILDDSYKKIFKNHA